MPTAAAGRPYTVLSCAVSVDGCLDDASPRRLILSGADDLDEVDELRASADAIVVGAGTVRADNPRLLVRSPARAAAREARGLPAHPLRVTLTQTGNLDPAASFFAGPGPRPLVYCAAPAAAALAARLGDAAAVAPLAPPLTLAALLQDLPERTRARPPAVPGLPRAARVRRVATVLIEGGAMVLAEALSEGLADELRLAIAPFFVGDARAPRFGLPAAYPHTAANPMRLASVRRLGDVSVLHYLLSTRQRPALPGRLPPS